MCLEWFLSGLIAFIGIGVTALLGVNIWYSLNISKVINNKISKGLDLLRAENEELKDELKYYSLSMSNIALGEPYARIGSVVTAIPYYVIALISANNSKDEKCISAALDRCVFVIDSKPNIGLDSLDNTDTDIAKFKKVLIDIKDERAYRIYSHFFLQEKV